MRLKILALSCTVVICHLALWTRAKSLAMGGSMVVAAERFEHRQKRSLKSSMTRMHIKSIVKSRFARVITTTTMENGAAKAKELTFSVRLPTNAFISKFSMNVDGVIFVGKVKEKERARAEYQGAKDKGNSAGLVTSEVRETQVFNVAANVPARASVTFSLEYQELLERRLGKYEQVLFINPRQIVDDLSVDVYITEEVGITTLETRHPERSGGGFMINGGYDLSGEVGVNVEIKKSKHQALVSFKPTQAQQRQMLMIPEDDRKVSVIYDVTRQEIGGEILMRDGYFVHFFAPANLPVLPKRIVFVIDRSGSMMGTKLRQTKEAFDTVLRDMSETDEFNIISFSERASVWNDGMVPVTADSVDRALTYVNRISASGGTNLNGALLRAVDILSTSERTSESLSAIIVLTDGDPTSGETNEDQIRRNVKSRINGAISLFCIGFGSSVNHDFLKKLANDNDGIARKIYSDSDATLQLKGFFQEVATPLLLNVNFQYIGEEISEVSKTNIDKYFKGSEVVVVGTMREHALLEARINAMNEDGEVQYSAIGREVTEFSHSEDETGDFGNFIERLWAYFTISGLLEEKVLADSQEEIETIITRVTSLALKYGFVTPFTSMVVVLPQDEITTPQAVTTESPIPVCLRKGVDIADDSNPSQMWCPYIFEGIKQEQKHTQTAALVHLRSFPPAQPQQLAMQSLPLSVPHYSAPISAPDAQIQYGTIYDYYVDDYSLPLPQPTPPPEPVVSTHCGGVLHNSKGRITLPSSLRSFHTSKVYCDWSIRVTNGSWIDVNIIVIKTSSTKIKISSETVDIFQHNGGTLRSKSYYIMSDHLEIRMEINPNETQTEKVRISYKQFIPGNNVVEQPTVRNLPEAPTCGRVITSDDMLSGNISSPGYPSPYPPNTLCSWTFNVNDPETHKLSLQLIDVDIETNELDECMIDSLVIMPSSGKGKICGIQENVDIDVESDSVTVTFISDDQMQGSGFLLNYKFIER